MPNGMRGDQDHAEKLEAGRTPWLEGRQRHREAEGRKRAGEPLQHSYRHSRYRTAVEAQAISMPTAIATRPAGMAFGYL